MSDRVGRKPVLVAGLLLQPLMGSLVAVVPTFPLFLLFRYLTGFALGNTMVISFVLGKYLYTQYSLTQSLTIELNATWMLFQGRKRVESSLKVLYYEYYTWSTNVHPPFNQNVSKKRRESFWNRAFLDLISS